MILAITKGSLYGLNYVIPVIGYHLFVFFYAESVTDGFIEIHSVFGLILVFMDVVNLAIDSILFIVAPSLFGYCLIDSSIIVVAEVFERVRYFRVFSAHMNQCGAGEFCAGLKGF